MNYVQECLASNLKTRRAIMNLSQEALAELAGLSPGFIANLETGRSWPSAKTLLKLSEALRLEPAKFFVDPLHDEIGYTKEELLMMFERVKNNFLEELPTAYSAPRHLLGADGDKRR
ncbi:MAG TPA: helix-turn-helix transcriptional regulator [Rectinemataceae bacterium]|nr:helix-turn-helix transcriptional regulator [Rectinemataceae bacterium]